MESHKEKITSFIEYLQEPLFAISILTSISIFIRFYLAGGMIYEGMPYIILLFFALSIYFTSIYLRGGSDRFRFIGIPTLIFIIMLFSFYVNWYDNSMLSRDYLIFSTVVAVFLLFYALGIYKIIRFSTAIVCALFFTALIMHLASAFAPYLSALDPYWYYKWGQIAYNTGFLPDYDNMTYPLRAGILRHKTGVGGGLDISREPFMWPLVMGSFGSALKPFGVSLHDVAMLYPGVFAAFSVVLIYVLVFELFPEMKPYNQIAAFIAAFGLIFNPAFAAKAVATNAEDDSMGMFIVLACFTFYFLAYRRKSLKIGLLAGFSFLLLRMSWSGGLLVGLSVFGVYILLHGIVNLIHKENCVEHIPYVLVSLIPVFIYPFIMHKRGIFFDFNFATKIGWFLVVSGISASMILEMIRSFKYGRIMAGEKTLEDKISNLLQKHIKPIGAVLALAGVIVVLSYGSNALYSLHSTFSGARTQEVVYRTIREQTPFANSIEEFMSNGYSRYGILFYYGWGVIPLLVYLVLERRSIGALFILTWSVPLMWFVYNNSVYMFASSVPIVLLGSTVGLFSVGSRKDFESLRIIGGIMVLVVPILYIPFFGETLYGRFVGYAPLHMMPESDIYLWYPALEWLGNSTKPNEAVITWWDYGHWITSISHRPVLIDNLQADHFEIQDVARFFVNATTEEEAFEIIDAYNNKYMESGVNLKYVVIDYTMIPKGSALHFIATGVIENKTAGSFRNYAICQFSQRYSTVKPQLTPLENGSFSSVRQLVFPCSGYIQGIIFDITEESISGISVVDIYGNKRSWSSWVKDNPASILGVHPLNEVLALALQRPDFLSNPNAIITTPNGILVSSQVFEFTYVPDEFNDFMMTRLYLGDHVNTTFYDDCPPEDKNRIVCASYLNQGLYTRNMSNFDLEHFEYLTEFSAGFVRVYEIKY